MLEKTAEAVREASKLMTSGGFEIMEKDGVENLVTSSDLAVQHFLTERLAEILPGSGFLCEEEDFRDISEEYVWIIDPIDGTANYARGIEDCCISVALARDGVLQAGVVYSPGRRELYMAAKGCGAVLDGRPIHVSARPFESGLLCTAMSTYRKEYAKGFFDYLCTDGALLSEARRRELHRLRFLRMPPFQRDLIPKGKRRVQTTWKLGTSKSRA